MILTYDMHTTKVRLADPPSYPNDFRFWFWCKTCRTAMIIGGHDLTLDWMHTYMECRDRMEPIIEFSLTGNNS